MNETFAEFAKFKAPKIQGVPIGMMRMPTMIDGYLVRETDLDHPIVEDFTKYIVANRRTLSPLNVRRTEGGAYVVFGGCHRFVAYQNANVILFDRGEEPITRIPCQVWDVTPTEALALGNLDNHQKMMTVAERSLAVAAFLARNMDLTCGEAAAAMGISEGSFKNYKVLRDLVPRAAAEVYVHGTISASVAYGLARLPKVIQTDWIEFCQRTDISSTEKVKRMRARNREIINGSPPGGDAEKEAIAAIRVPLMKSIHVIKAELARLEGIDIPSTYQKTYAVALRWVLGLDA